MSYNGYDIYRLMKEEGVGTKHTEEASDTSKKLGESYLDLSEELESETEKMQEFWKGEGSDGAAAALRPLQDVNLDYSSNMSRTHGAFNGLMMGFTDARDNLQEMTPSRPEPIADVAGGSATVARKAWDIRNKNNISQYQAYMKMKDANKESLPNEYPPIDLKSPSGDSESGSSKDSGSDSTGVHYVSGPNATAESPSGTFSGGSVAPGSGGAGSAPGPSGSSAGSDFAGSPGGAQQPSDSSTSSAGYTTPGPAGGGSQHSSVPGVSATSGNHGSSGSGHGAAAPGAVGGFGPRNSGGGAGVGGGRGGAAGSGPGSGSGFGPRGNPDAQPGAGRSSGAVSGGSGGTQAARGATAPTTGGSGSSSGGRAPMMGAPGAKGGQDGEEEHDRKFTVTPDDPDDVFGGIPEGTVVSPPVIGE